MQTVIIPLDFSETSFNAAHYAAVMYKKRSDVTLILYHFYSSGEDEQNSKTYLESLATELAASGTAIETFQETGDNFIDSFASFAYAKRAYLVIMGLTGKSKTQQFFYGSNTLKMAEKDICPVLIIPAAASYRPVKNVMIASEMKYVEETPALLAVKRVLEEFKPSLHILNVDSSHYVALTEEFKEERNRMETLLAEFKPEFYFMRLYDFHEAINAFTEDKKIDMVVIAPRHHSIFERMFKTQHTKPLIYQSKVPVLAVYE